MGDVVQAIVVLVVAAFVMGLGSRPVGRRQIEHFGARFGVVVSGEDGSFVAARLHRSRVLRSSAVALGIVVGGLPAYMNLIDPGRAGDFAVEPLGYAWLFGAVLAAVAAEILVVQRPVRGGEAALVERRPEHYVSSRWVRTAAVPAGAALLLFGVAVVSTDAELLGPSTGATGALVTLWAVTAGLRRIAERPRLEVAGRLEGLDDALRAHGAHHVVGAAVMLGAMSLLLTAAPVLNEAAPALNLVTGLLAYAALGIWYALARNVPWRARAPEGSTT